ncbi:MAG: TetR/AcrR family transcriptional regulator [Rhodospirillaceae bacterium]|nr:TetR/AcrR family transcriptional regulator [Rhodospirillaceae bacterium]
MPRHEQFDTDDVLMRAMNLFWRQGYQATSMTDLAKVMGLGRASIYSEFGNKHGLFVRALRHYDKVWRENWLADLTKSSSPREAILDVFEAAIDACLAGGSRDGCLLINTALEFSPHDPEVADIVTRAFTEMEAFFRTSVERGKALGEIRDTVAEERTASALLGLFIGLRVLVRSRPEEPLLRSIMQQAEDLVPRGAT